MSPEHAVKRIVVGVDGSEQAAAALEWAIRYARLLNAEIIAVYVIPTPMYFGFAPGYHPPIAPAQLDPELRADMKRLFEQVWCKPMVESGLKSRTVLADGRPASVITDVADRENADLIVVGRRGRGGAAEMLLGSVSREVTHRSKRPVVVISQKLAGETQPVPVTAEEKA